MPLMWNSNIANLSIQPIWLKRFQQIRYFFVWFSADWCYHHTNEFKFKGTIIFILIDSSEIRLIFFSLLNILSSIVGMYLLLLFVNIVAKILAVDSVFRELKIFKIWFIEFTFTKVTFTILNQILRNGKKNTEVHLDYNLKRIFSFKKNN